MNVRQLSGIALIAILAAACSASATPSAGAPGAASPAPPTGSTAAGATATATATAYPTPSSDTIAIAPTPTAAPSAAASAVHVATPAPRVAWVTGQTIKQDVLVAPGVGWVLTNRGLWQTIDDGASWANAYPRSVIAASIRGLGAFDANHALLAAVDVAHATSTYYIWHTSNAGQTWAYTALPPIAHDIRPSPCSPGDFCGQPGDPPAYFDFVNASTAFVWICMLSGIDGRLNSIFETTDGGATWVPRTHNPTIGGTGPTPPASVHFMSPSVGVAQVGNEISSTTTGWGHWTERLLPETNISNPTVSFLNSTDWMVDMGLNYGTVQQLYAVSSDQGHTWVDHTVDVPGISGLHGAEIQFLSPAVWIGTIQTGTTSAFTAGPSQTIYATDGGAHWAIMGPQPFNGSIATFVDAGHGWTGPNDQAQSARLYSTSNGGLSWRLLTP